MTLITRKSKWTSLITTPGFNRFQNWISWPARSIQICKFLEEEHLDARKRTEMEWKRGIIDPCGGEFEKQHWHSQEEPVRRMIWSLTPAWRRMWSMRKCKYLQCGSVESLWNSLKSRRPCDQWQYPNYWKKDLKNHIDIERVHEWHHNEKITWTQVNKTDNAGSCA